MKALILAAGFGTRLLPHTLIRPKPLFTLAGIPILKITIEKLLKIGCRDILVNTHHLYGQIREFIDNTGFPVSVKTIHEPDILDTGGAIKNVGDFMGSSNFMVINGDIVTDIDLESVWQFHIKSKRPVNLVLHDCSQFNKVQVNHGGVVCGFSSSNTSGEDSKEIKLLAFTGIQVLSPEIFQYMPQEARFSSIDLYQDLAQRGDLVGAYVAHLPFWEDIGTPRAYQRAALCHLGAKAFKDKAVAPGDIKIEPLAGDGSDREWFRIKEKESSLVVSCHGISTDSNVSEIDSFIAIGNHLGSKKIPVPEILAQDRFSGMVVLEDLGDTHLATILKATNSKTEVIKWYCRVVDLLIDFSLKGIEGFDPNWTFQTQSYSKELIIERECNYFADAFLRGYLKQEPPMDLLLPEFELIADLALKGSITGLMHRDFQSRNIMVKNGEIFFIDFQSARKGPIQYDLASLLIDPYMNLDQEIREELLLYCIKALAQRKNIDSKTFIQSFRYCCVTRNLQILGAFSYLSMVKKKKWFNNYIPCGVLTLKSCISYLDRENIPILNSIIGKL